MTIVWNKYFLIVPAIIIVGTISAYLYHTKYRPADSGNAVIAVNDTEKQQAKQTAENLKKQVAIIASQLQESETARSAQKAEITRLKTIGVTLASQPKPTASSDEPVTADPEKENLKQTVAAQTTYIAGLEDDNSKLQVEVKTLNLRCDSLATALKASEQNESIQNIQKEGQIAAIKSARWTGRFEGFTAGAVLTGIGVAILHL